MQCLTNNDIEEIELDLTGICNLSCPLCTRNYKHALHLIKKNIRSLNDIKIQLNQFKNLKRILLAGAVSEPTLYPDFFNFIRYLNNRNIQFELFTNGNTHDIAWWKKLSKITRKKCKVIFTICGSTQELHEKYRKGSNLQQILNNARAFKNTYKNDWIQFIRFEYNKNELNNKNMLMILNQFSHRLIVDSEGDRRLNEKILSFDADIKPVNKRDYAIKYILKQRNKPSQIFCKSYIEKKLYINQFGEIFPCYIFAEFQNNHFINNIYDYSNILNYAYPDCFTCSNYAQNMILKLNLEFIN